MSDVKLIAENAKIASGRLASLSADIKNNALSAIADSLETGTDKIKNANQHDLDVALNLLNSGEISSAVFNRLKLDDNKLRDMINGVRDVIKLDDPINQTLFVRELADGLILKKISCPIGLIGVIFEARPDVIAQISSLAVKSGNAVLLKGGKEAINTNKAIFDIITDALSSVDGFPPDVINLLYSRDDVTDMLAEEKYIDLIIPRGSNELVKFIQSNTKIPVLGHSSGICHIFVDEDADLQKALRIITDSKCQYPSACNAVETVLVHANIINKFLPVFIDSSLRNNIKINSDINGINFPAFGNIKNYSHEYGEKELSLICVNDVRDAVKHINKYGSGHTDCIITENKNNSDYFISNVDSAGVFVNVSTRFSDGFRYGFGAEVGISTNKTHARGPVGLDGLTIYKYILTGNGDIVGDFCSGLRNFTHKNIT